MYLCVFFFEKKSQSSWEWHFFHSYRKEVFTRLFILFCADAVGSVLGPLDALQINALLHHLPQGATQTRRDNKQSGFKVSIYSILFIVFYSTCIFYHPLLKCSIISKCTLHTKHSFCSLVYNDYRLCYYSMYTEKL